MEYFYRQKHPEYRVLPPYAPGCSADRAIPVIEFIYPSPGVKIFIPRDQTGLQTRVIPEVVHRNASKKIFWHLDEKFVGITSFVHQIEILADAGDHVLTVVDEDGNSSSCGFSVIGRND
jgi:penicillin-binding protein 1C